MLFGALSVKKDFTDIAMIYASRTHAVSVVDTFATLLIIIALMVNYGFTLFSLKLLLILIFLYITGSTAIHALTQAYLKSKSKGELK